MARRRSRRAWRRSTSGARLGDPLKEGESLRWLSHLYWREGDAAEAATAALEVLEPLPPGPELAMAYSNLAQLRMLDHDLEGTLQWGNRAIALAEELGETETLVHALNNVGSARSLRRGRPGARGADPEPAARPRPRAPRPRRPGVGQSGLYDDVGHAARRGRSPAGHRHRLRDRARSRLPPWVSPGDASGPPRPSGQLGRGRDGDPPASPAADVIVGDADDGADDVGPGVRSPWQSRGRGDARRGAGAGRAHR